MKRNKYAPNGRMDLFPRDIAWNLWIEISIICFTDGRFSFTEKEVFEANILFMLMWPIDSPSHINNLVCSNFI